MKLSTTVSLAFALFIAIGSTACNDPQCQLMTRCCEALADLDGVGHACGEMSAGVTDPKTCTSIVQTLTYMVEDQGASLPAQCLEQN